MPLSVRFENIPVEPTCNNTPLQQNGVLINSVFDYIMENVRANMATLGRYRTVDIPDLKERVEMAPSVSASVAGTLRASRGTLRDLTTLCRAGDLTMWTDEGALHVSGAIALRNLSATFRHYSLQAAVFKKSGDLLALKVGKNAFNISLTIRLDGVECDVWLERISATKFSDVTVEMTGFSVLNPVSSKVAQWVIHSFQGFIKDIVERYAKEMVNGTVKDKALITRLMGYGIEGMVLRTHGSRKFDWSKPQEDTSFCKCSNSGVTITVKPCTSCGHKVIVF